jgi:hypothetical protein
MPMHNNPKIFAGKSYFFNCAIIFLNPSSALSKFSAISSTQKAFCWLAKQGGPCFDFYTITN